jgi:CHAT domain-containing protein/Tfp pilus assembly protein PilF
VEIGKKALGEKHPDYAGSLNNLAELYRSQGEYARAEPLYRQAMGIIREALGENHPGYAVSLGNLALLYQAQGDYARAEPLYRQAMVIEKKLFGENHPAYARSLNNLASLYSARRDYARAEPLLRQAMEIGKNALGDKHPDYAVSLNNLAFLYLLQDDYARAEPLFRQAMEITKQALGENHPDYATGLNNLASLHRVRGDYARAGPLYRKALEITKQALGENHPDYAESLHNLAILCFAQGDAARAVSAERQAVSIERGNLEVTAVVQSERQQLAKLKSVRVYLDMYLALTAGQDQFSVPAYQEMLAWKGAVFRRERLVRAGEQTPELAAAFQKLQRVTAQFAKQAWATPDPKQAAHWRENVEQLSAEKERLEAELSARSAAFRQARKQSTLEELQQALPKDAVLVDFLEYAHFMPINNTTVRKAFSVQRLLAFVVRHEGPVERIDLGLLQPLNAVIQSWRESFGASARGAGAGKLLREKLWEPIEAKLGGAKIVLVSPDGALNRLPLAALPGKEAGRYLIEDYALAIVPTAQMIPELVQEGSGKPPPKNLLLMGNIDYDAAGAAVPDVPASPMMLASSRAAITTFGRLDATEAEVAQIAKLCPQDSTTGGVTTLQNSQASKAAFLAEGGRHRYLHLATHGFFIEEKLSVLPGSGPREPGRFGDLLQGPVAAEIHPALRCGLALAGANRAAKQSDVDPMSDKRDDNGILTAEEIGAQNLDGVQLVVLSACETGLGKSVAGEGVLGLQRSFQAAGARAVVASLWRVDDQATQTLMVEFYKNLWEKKLGKLGALRQAQLAMLHSYDRTAGQLRGPDFSKSEPLSAGSAPKKPATGGRQSLSPAYWAAFVLSGDWR